MAHEDVRQTILEMIQILEEGGDDNWVAFFRSALAHLDAGDPVSCDNRIRSGFGGMGSLNDLCISDRFDELLDEIGAFTSRSIISDRGSITGTAKRLYDQGAALHQACLEKLNSNEATLNVPELIKDLEEANGCLKRNIKRKISALMMPFPYFSETKGSAIDYKPSRPIRSVQDKKGTNYP